MKKLNAQNMTWIDTQELAAKDATIASLTRERDALLVACKATEKLAHLVSRCSGCPPRRYCHSHFTAAVNVDGERRAALALCEGGA